MLTAEDFRRAIQEPKQYIVRSRHLAQGEQTTFSREEANDMARKASMLGPDKSATVELFDPVRADGRQVAQYVNGQDTMAQQKAGVAPEQDTRTRLYTPQHFENAMAALDRHFPAREQGHER